MAGKVSQFIYTGILALAAGFGATDARAQTLGEGSVKDRVESAFATALILTDSEAIQFGALAVDPGDYFSPLDSDNFGSEESLDRRRSVRMYAVPLDWEFSSDSSQLTPRIRASLSYLEARQDVIIGNGDGRSGEQRDRVYGGYLEGGFVYQFNSNWRGSMGAGMHLSRYDNRFSGNLSVIDALQPDDDLLDADASALIGQLRARATYESEIHGVPWKFRSTYSYYAGETVDAAGALENVTPETWSWSNGVTVHWPMPKVFGTSNQLRFEARRVDVGGDVTDALDTRNFYQFGVGWLFGGPDDVSWINNIGLGLSLNVGSSFSGGTLKLLYNEEF